MKYLGGTMMFAVCALLVTYVMYQEVRTSLVAKQLVETPSPRYRVGTCFMLRRGEQEMRVWKIEVVREDHYIVRATPSNIWRNQEGYRVDFLIDEVSRPVECPRGENTQ